VDMRVTPVCVLVKAMLAPAIKAPLGSVTVPLTVPRLVWAKADAWNMNAHARSVATVSSLEWVLTVYLLHLRATGWWLNKLGIGRPCGAFRASESGPPGIGKNCAGFRAVSAERRKLFCFRS
jgi:hypothetical protein